MNDSPQHTAVFVADLCSGGGGAAYLRRGWADPETAGTWTLGRESRFAIDWSPEWGDATLALRATPHLFPDLAAARLAVIVNDIPVGTFAVSQGAEITCRVAPWMISSERTLEITLHHPDAMRPNALSASTDARELGFSFARIELRCPTAEPAALSQSTPPPAGDLAILRQFDSLGDNCELGLVQRRCGVEQLGLLRFAQMPIASVIAGLETRFESLDDPQAIAVRPSLRKINGRSEYFVYHGGYGASWHTGTLEGDRPPERIHAEEHRKLRYLKRNLLEDLERAARIYVVRRAARLQRDEVLKLWRVLRRYGPNTLLWVVPADAIHRPGTVAPMEPGLLQGFIDHLAPDDDPTDISARGWIELCRHALKIRDAG